MSFTIPDFVPLDLVYLVAVIASALFGIYLLIVIGRLLKRIWQPRDKRYWKGKRPSLLHTRGLPKTATICIASAVTTARSPDKWPSRGVAQLSDFTVSNVDRYHRPRRFSPGAIRYFMSSSRLGVIYVSRPEASAVFEFDLRNSPCVSQLWFQILITAVAVSLAISYLVKGGCFHYRTASTRLTESKSILTCPFVVD